MGGTYRQHADPLLKKQRNQCHYCGQMVSRKYDTSHPLRATLDHRIPRSRGGVNARHNLVIACYACNAAKANKTDVEFVHELLRNPPAAHPFASLLSTVGRVK
jgi:5-methylcytosine-specific restriction endonuclease McrA